MTPGCVRVGELARGAVVVCPVPVRVGGKVGAVDGDDPAELGKLISQGGDQARFAQVDCALVPEELACEAVAGYSE